MKESIGAGWLMTIVIAFIVFFSGFLALSINYAKAFRVKDSIIEEIEKADGFTTEAQDNITAYLSEIGYVNQGNCSAFFDEFQTYYGVNINDNNPPTKNGTQRYNYCLQKVTARQGDIRADDGVSGTYYKVIVFFNINLPYLDSLKLFSVSGETSYIFFAKDNLEF